VMDENIVLYDISMLLGRSKNSTYKESIISAATSLIRFLHENKLLVDISPFDENGRLKVDSIIKKNNLTEEGFKLFSLEIIDRWENYLDKSSKPSKHENIKILKNGLERIRANQII